MEFMDGTWKKEINTWEELVGNNLLNQEAVIEGAVHSIRNMGDVAFIILRRREGLFQTVYENEMANVSIHELKEAMTIRVKGILHEEERAPHGRELRIRHIDILSTPAEPLPMAIDKWKLNTSLEAKLNYRPISVIIFTDRDSQKSILRRSEPEEQRVGQTFSNSATSTNLQYLRRAHSSTNR